MSKYFTYSLLIGLYLFNCNIAIAQVREYKLHIAESSINLTGKTVKRITVNGEFPAPKLEFEEGDEAIIHVYNHLKNQDSSIHWHGLLLPGLMDGVPGFNGFQGIKPNEHFVYRFTVRQSGTYWYHAHSKGQEQDGLYGALVIYPKGNKSLAEHEKTQRDYVVMLSDFHESSSQQIMRNLKKSAEYYQDQRETVFDIMQQIQRDGLKSTWQDRSMWNQMRMLKTDLSDVSGYTFLMNGQTNQQYWTGVFEAHEKVRLRFINASAMSFFDVNIPNLKMTVVSADGQPIEPVTVDEFRIGAAESYDVIIEPKAMHYQIQAESIDRSSFAIGLLQPHDETSKKESNKEQTKKYQINIPKSRARALLTMEDMGHGESDQHRHESGNHDVVIAKSQRISQLEMDSPNHPKMDIKESPSKDKQEIIVNHEHNQSSSDRVKHKMRDQSADQISQFNAHAHLSQISTPDSHSNDVSPTLDTVQGWANADTPTGHKALQYSDLRILGTQTDLRPAMRELEIRLGGTMERYIWTINGKKFNEAKPLHVRYGERIRLKFINESMMAHPMHLHGMFMQLENGQSISKIPNKHTVIVAPGKTVTAFLTADELGEWAIHCHLLYHMTAGMMTKLIVANVEGDALSQPHPFEHSKSDDGELHEHH